jgi:hypothetical protein
MADELVPSGDGCSKSIGGCGDETNNDDTFIYINFQYVSLVQKV